MAKNSPNDYTIQNANTIYGASAGDIMDFKISLNAILSQHRTPAIVQSYNAETNEVIVKIALKHTLPERNDDGTYKRIDYANVKTTVRQPFANGVGILFFPKKGDTGWLEASDNDTSEWKKQDDLTQTANSNFSESKYPYGCFVPDIINNTPNVKRFTIIQGEENSLCIQSTDGGSAICINANGKIHIIAKNGLTFDTNIQVNGNVVVSGDVIADGISLVNHLHSGVQAGKSNTNKPVK